MNHLLSRVMVVCGMQILPSIDSIDFFIFYLFFSLLSCSQFLFFFFGGFFYFLHGSVIFICIGIIFLTYTMNETNFLNIYLRQTNGVGQKITLNPAVTLRQLSSFASQIFNIPDKSFDIYFKGAKLVEKPEKTMQELKIQSESIIHIQKISEGTVTNQYIQLRVFCQGSLYSYTTSKNSTFSELKIQIATMLGCAIGDITISYLGKITDDTLTLEQTQIKDKDLISVIICPSQISRFGQRSASWLKPKITQSLTFANSDELDPNYEPFAKQVMRKSSMKSSHQSRQLRIEESKRLLQVIRPKSELSRSNSKNEPGKQEQANQLAWLSNQKMIQTESINFDDPQQEEGPQSWTDCQLELVNTERTKFYTLLCSQNNDLQAVLKVLRKHEGIEVGKQMVLIFGDELSQQMAEMGKSMLYIAKASGTKILRNIVFSY